MKAKFKYTGKLEQRHTIERDEIVLVDGNTVELPVGSQKVAQLRRAGILELVEPAAIESKPKSK